MASGLYSGVSGIALGTGLYRNVSGLWGGASGFVTGDGGAALNLDFLTMTAPTFDSRITFTRGSNATLTDSTGKITYAPANLLLQSQTFDNASWTKSGTSVVTGAQANPVDGLVNAQKMVENTAAGNHRVQQSFTSATGVTYTFSCYAKAAERTWVYLYDDISNAFAYFNLAAGTVGTVGAGWTSTSITSVGSGWYRISATATEAAGGGGNQLIGLASANGTSSYTGDGTSGIYIWGAQLEPVTYQTTPGTYQATTSSAYYGPRFDYDPVTLAAKGLLIEEQRTNLLTYSEQFDNAAWAKTNATVTANVATAPDGTTTADKLVENTATAEHRAFQGFTLAAIPYTLSVYAKPSGRNWVSIGSTAASIFAFFDIANGTVGTQTNCTGTITAVSGGWYRVSITFTPSAGAISLSMFTASANGTNSYTGDGTSGIYLWGAQLEAGAFATSYIPTVASTVTRSADVATMTGTNFSSWYNQTAGSFVFDADSFIAAAVDFPLTASDGTANNRFGIYRSSAAIGGYVTTGGVAQMDLTRSSITVNTAYKAAVAATANDGNMALNGTAAAGDTSITMPTVDRLSIGNSNGSGFMSGHIRAIVYYNTRLSNAQLQSLTT